MNSSEKQIDEQLVIQYQSGSNKALSELVKRWHLKFCKKAFYIVKDPDIAKDIAQESWNTIINKLNTLKEPKSFGSWSLRIVHTKAIDVLRAKQRRSKNRRLMRFEIVDGEPYTAHDELMQELLLTIEKLTVEQQQVVRLFYLKECSLAEIAQLLNIKKGTVKSRLFHAREKLKTILKNRNYEN